MDVAARGSQVPLRRAPGGSVRVPRHHKARRASVSAGRLILLPSWLGCAHGRVREAGEGWAALTSAAPPADARGRRWRTCRYQTTSWAPFWALAAHGFRAVLRRGVCIVLCDSVCKPPAHSGGLVQGLWEHTGAVP